MRTLRPSHAAQSPARCATRVPIATQFSRDTTAPTKSIRKLRQCGWTYLILIPEMTKRKPGRFSATKAVKANARERVGQPKPARVVDDTPRTGRGVKHKPTLEKILRQEE